MPRRRQVFQPSADRLEAQVLLSSAASALALAGLPISETVTTDKAAYKVGQPIRITLTETNNTNATVAVPDIGHGGGFTATRDMETVWVSRGRSQGAGSSTLQPGQTRTVNVVWNGRPNVANTSHSRPVTGTVEIDNTLANDTVTIVIDPRHGKGSTAGPTSALPNFTLALAS